MINYNNIKVSLFKNYSCRIPEEINLWEWLKDDSRKAEIEYLRTLNDKDDIQNIKSGLPCITASGVFSGRNLSTLKNHSGIICIDIDAKDNPDITDFEKQRDELCNILNIAYCSLSASGRGVFCLIAIEHPEKHKQHFESLKCAFKELGIVIDKNCGDVTRLRGYTYDPKAYFNESAIVYSNFYVNDIKAPPKLFKVKANYSIKSGSNTRQTVINILTKIQNAQIDITGDYGQWFQIGCALANEFGEEGREIFHSVSQFADTYKFPETDNQFNRCMEGSYKYSIGTFIHWAEEYNMV